MGSKYCYFLAGGWRENANKDRLQKVADELVNRGHRVIILIDGQRTHLINPNANPAFYTWPSNRPTAINDAVFLSRLIDNYHPDCLVAQFGSVNIMMGIGLLRQVRTRVVWHRTISSAIDADALLPPWKLKMLRWRKRLVFRCATSFITNSAANRDDLIDVFSVHPSKISVLPNHLQDPFTNNPGLRNIPRTPAKVVCVGRLNFGKGQSTLIRTAKKLSDIPGLLINFIGGGDQFDHYQALVKEIGVEGICRFSGNTTHAQVFQEMASAEVVVVPSLFEAFGYVSIEAMSVGTPVVASRVGGLEEIIRDGLDGILVPPGNEDDLAEAIRKILMNAQMRDQFGANARQRFLDMFEAQRNIQREADLLEDLVSENR